jgi:hypothetical protein
MNISDFLSLLMSFRLVRPCPVPRGESFFVFRRIPDPDLFVACGNDSLERRTDFELGSKMNIDLAKDAKPALWNKKRHG